MRATSVGLLLGAVFSLPARAADCGPAPAGEPTIESGESWSMVRRRLDYKWAKCAREAGGTLQVVFLVGADDAGLKPFRTKEVKGGTLQEGLWDSNDHYCREKPLPRRGQIRLEGTGPFAALAWTSPTYALGCRRCAPPRSYAGHFAVHVRTALTPKGMITVDAGYDPEFQQCAQEGSTLEVRVYEGRTHDEAWKTTEPTFALKGLEKTAKFKKPIPEAEVCRDKPAWLGFEFFGTGEMDQLNGSGRSVVKSPCGP